MNGTNFTSSAKGNYAFPQRARQPGLQLQRPWRSGGPGSGSPAASTFAAGAASNADLSGRFGDPCDVGMSSAAATAPAARSDRARRTRLSSIGASELPGIPACPGVFLVAERRHARREGRPAMLGHGLQGRRVLAVEALIDPHVPQDRRARNSASPNKGWIRSTATDRPCR